jgi:anhydro-N-acetylmuramic acid kinase
MPAVLAERTGITTVSDFMSRDVAAGGQGIPIDALGDYLLFRDVCETRVLIHLGGGARVVYLPAGGSPQSVLGFDAGPCNNLLDGLIQQLTGGQEEFDPGGKHAVQGRCMEVLLKRWLAHPFVQRRPPKSLRGQSCAEEIIAQAAQFSQDPALPIYDLLCTATHFVVHVITQSMRRFLPANSPPNRVLLSGGGIRNGLLWRLLEQHLVGIPMEKTDRFGAPAEARKAIGSGILAALTIDGVPGNVPSATGAAGARLLGSLTPGSSANWARCLTWMANQTAPLAVALD